MPSLLAGLLTQSLRECCEEIQLQQADLRNLAGGADFSWAHYWLVGIADGLRDTYIDLEKWCDRFEKRNPIDEASNLRNIESSQHLADWIRELTISIQRQLRNAREPNLSQEQCSQIFIEISQDLNAIKRQITSVKELDNLNNSKLVKEAVRQNQIQVESIKVLFEDRIRNLLPEHRQGSFCIYYGERGLHQFEEMEWFWSKIPRPAGMSRDKNNRHDGLVFNTAHISKARFLLQMFVEAWLTVNGEPIDRPSLDIMRHMPAVACVLHAAGKEALFNRFIASEIKDSALEQGWDAFRAKVEEALGSQSQAREVVAQFSRYKERPWADGAHLELDWSEPLPLQEKTKLRETKGPVGVYKVEDVWNPGIYYALKVVRTETANDVQLGDLKNEIAKLITIGREKHGHHIVQCVKTFERGRKGDTSEIGMLLWPVASSDLNKFLNTCSREPDTRKRYTPNLIQAFGCLAYSLAYLHNVQDMRHRDVKPHNILVHWPPGSKQPEFVWADFGLAFVFREQGFSGDPNPNFGATPEYEAPEINPELISRHTRAADIFALGCVFTEILWVLSLPERAEKDQIQLRALYWEHSKKMYYKHHLRGLNDWLSTTEAKSRGTLKWIRPYLQLAGRMIQSNADKRPKIGDVVRDLWKINTGSGTDKPFCQHCVDKLKKDTGRNPLHPDILKHKRNRASDGLNTIVPFRPNSVG